MISNLAINHTPAFGGEITIFPATVLMGKAVERPEESEVGRRFRGHSRRNLPW
jgi:hypothetical protein